ncbi:hypothetical protein C0993_008777 [Termitomyces sp. T159_Od127]|nr:hypothetical protein C0993_008777 [Termitomyces sp. T159_Od127]
MNRPHTMQPEIIDLTGPEYEVSSETINPITVEKEKKPRWRKRKRTEGDSTPGLVPTRDASLVDGKIELKTIDAAHDDPDVPHNATGHRKERRLNKKRERQIAASSSTSSWSKDPKQEDLFFIDLEPVPFPAASQFPPTLNVASEKKTELLLPAHVSVFGEEPAELLAPENGISSEEFIEYLDFDDNSKNIVRYFEEPILKSPKPKRAVCKNCGAEGEHTTATCPVLIECPTLWRLYEYLTEEAKCLVLRTRKAKQNLAFGEGGEGYIADDKWCYNCGTFGHWGDDCEDVPHREDVPNEYSAFSEHNTSSGPFFDSVTETSASQSRRRERRNRDPYYDLPPSWGHVPENVGRKGRRENTAQMERRAQEQAAEDDPDDWFGNPQNARSRGVAPNNSGRKSNPPKKLVFGKSLEESAKHFRPPSPPRLLDRIGGVYYADQSRPEKNLRDAGLPRKPRRKPKRDERSERDRRRDDVGPRYRGGYSR